MMCFEAVAVCNVPGCTNEEKVRYEMDETHGPTIFMLNTVPIPDGWEYQFKAGKRVLACPGCVGKRVLVEVKDGKEKSPVRGV
jgi:hypothetical protein